MLEKLKKNDGKLLTFKYSNASKKNLLTSKESTNCNCVQTSI